LLGLEITVYALFGALIMFNFVNQIEVPVGRGKPPVLIEKDESLDKVNFSDVTKYFEQNKTCSWSKAKRLAGT
jgi:hypothetical protein